jgi:hypothetical protein
MKNPAVVGALVLAGLFFFLEDENRVAGVLLP